MGISDGTAIKKLLRGMDAGVLETETARNSAYKTYEDAGYWIIDCMLDIYTKPPYVKTGKQLSRWYFNKVLPALLDGKTVILIFDDSRSVPKNKAACQQKRRSKAPKVPDGLTISDEGELHEWFALLSSGKYRLMIYEYILMGLADHVRGIPTSHDGCLIVNRPWARNDLYDTDWLDGGAVEVTDTNAPLPPRDNPHGEGDMLCRVWSDFIAERDPDAKIMIKSKDLDMLGIYAVSPPKGDCHLHITTTREKSKTTHEYVRVRALHNNLLTTRTRALSFTYALILAGSDFCEGVRGVGGAKIVNQMLQTPDRDSVVQYVDGKPRVDVKNLQRLINGSRKSGNAFNMEKQRLAYRRANWNLDYWLYKHKVPDPLAYRGWKRAPNGYMPLLSA